MKQVSIANCTWSIGDRKGVSNPQTHHPLDDEFIAFRHKYYVAEKEGVEPSIVLRLYTLSRRTH